MKVKFGLSNVHIAKLIEQDGQLTYGKPFKMPGAKSLTTDPEGDVSKYFADNICYYIANANQGYSGDLEITMLIKEFFTEILGQEEDKNGVLFESADDLTARFALMGEIDGDTNKRRFIYYDCTATRPGSEASTTEETKEPQTDKVSITMSPRNTDKVIKATIDQSDNNKDVYDSFFEKVYEKQMPTEENNGEVTEPSQEENNELNQNEEDNGVTQEEGI